MEEGEVDQLEEAAPAESQPDGTRAGVETSSNTAEYANPYTYTARRADAELGN